MSRQNLQFERNRVACIKSLWTWILLAMEGGTLLIYGTT